jgi:hypothetical protein
MNDYEEIEFDMTLIMLLFFLFAHSLFIYGAYSGYLLNNENDDDREKNEVLPPKEQPNKYVTPIQIPYQEKYLMKVRNMKNEYVFTEKELELQQNKLQQLEQEENKQKLESIYDLNEKIEELKIKLSELNIDIDHNNNFHDDLKKKSNKDDSIIKKIHDSIQNEINLNNKQLMDLQDKSLNIDELKEQSQQYIIDEQLKEFKKKYIIEHTPLGNVLMFYNHDKLAFEYYSDLTIPYRYLDTVARKYVLTYNYRPLYIDMEEELKDYEKKLEEQEKKMKQLQELEENDKMNPNNKSKPKDVFAKFKSYNKEAGTGRVNVAAPPKNNMPQNRAISNINLKDNKKDGSNNEKLLLKERANRYSYQGKFLNFNILQKVDKKVVDKKYALTFADFKKMNKDKLENKN